MIGVGTGAARIENANASTRIVDTERTDLRRMKRANRKKASKMGEVMTAHTGSSTKYIASRYSRSSKAT